MAHTMCVVAQLPPELGGASGKVCYFVQDDTPVVDSTRWHTSTLKACQGNLPTVQAHRAPGTFRPDRIRSIADRFGVDGTMALENILYGELERCPLDYHS